MKEITVLHNNLKLQWAKNKSRQTEKNGHSKWTRKDVILFNIWRAHENQYARDQWAVDKKESQEEKAIV